MDAKKIKEIVNLTGHNITIFLENGEKKIIPPKVAENGNVISLSIPYYVDLIGEVDKIKIFRSNYMISKNILNSVAPKKDGTIYIVGGKVAQLFPERDDFYVVAEVVRDPINRKLVGAKGITPAQPNVAFTD